MSKEQAKQFLDLVQEDVDLQEKVMLREVFTEAAFNEKIRPLANEKGLDFTFEELQNPYTGSLNDDELDAVAGGGTSKDGYWFTTLAFGCDKWQPSSDLWGAIQGQCGSCANWTSSRIFTGVCIVNRE